MEDSICTLVSNKEIFLKNVSFLFDNLSIALIKEVNIYNEILTSLKFFIIF